MRKSICALLFFCSSLFVVAQPAKGKVVVAIVNEQGGGIENLATELLRSKDSVLVKIALTDKNGAAEFEQVAAGNYLLKAAGLNYQAVYSAPFEITADISLYSVPVIKLFPSTAQLSGVTVTARKPFIQKLADRIVVNVENSIVSAGSSALDVLERSPGVLVDPNDNISLRGRQGVIIMIDGKISPMSGTELANFLRGLPSNSIERIEIITNPSAKYDAAGNSGIIDIRMKKDQRLGVNGTFTAGYGQGVYPKANTGASLNYRNKKVNVFGNYNYAFRKGLNHLFLLREFYKDGKYDGAYDQDNFMRFPVQTHTARAGADFFPNKKTVWGVVVSANFSGVDRKNNNTSLVLDKNGQHASSFNTATKEHTAGKNMLANLNYKYTFDSTGKEITADADYGFYNSSNLSNFSTGFYTPGGMPLLPDYKLKGDQQGEITLATLKADYTHPLSKTAKLEAGFKTSLVKTDNDVVFFDVSNALPEYDSSKSNRFNYRESNYALYTNYSKDWKKWSLIAGLRAEQTNIKGVQEVGNTGFDSSYLQFFPSLFLNYKLTEEKTWGISISRRIDRPNYSQLNPFRFFLDPSTYSSGNPYLKPQLTWSYELSYTLKQISFTLGYSHTRDNTTVVIRPSEDEDKVTIQIPVNLNTYDYYGLTVAAPFRFTKWWNSINNLNLYYGHYNGNLANTSLNNGTPVVSISSNNTFTLPKSWTAELNAFYYSGGLNGFMTLRPQWQLSTGVQKMIMKNKGTLRLSITDIFWTNLPQAKVEFSNYIENWRAERDTRVATLSFTYRFGNNKVQAARRRATASEEERQRAGN